MSKTISTIIENLKDILQIVCAIMLGYYIFLYKTTRDDLLKEKLRVKWLESYIIENEEETDNFILEYNNYEIILKKQGV